ncbi:MAG: hypothetical protein LZF61_03245 [Nitrosomonas sp.]|nr:MAG: hypothetical protein LZF61_03245 [Nitrosomonas sp.]
MQIQTLRLIMALLLMLMAMLYFHTSREKEYYSKGAEPAVVQILKEISSWEKSIFLLHLAPEAKYAINEEQLQDLLDFYRNFGYFLSIKEIDFSRTISMLSLFGEKRINYSGVANFSAGEINFNVTLIERGGYYLVYNLSMSKLS